MPAVLLQQVSGPYKNHGNLFISGPAAGYYIPGCSRAAGLRAVLPIKAPCFFLHAAPVSCAWVL